MLNESNVAADGAMVSRSNLSVDTATMKRLTRSENLPTGGHFCPLDAGDHAWKIYHTGYVLFEE